MDDQRLEPYAIDDRSPGVNTITGGRAGLDLAALVWMLCTITFVGCEIYSVLQITGNGFGSGFDSSGWDKVAALATTGGPLVALSCIAAIALAAQVRSTASRVALLLATVVGGWIAIAGALQIASVLRRGDHNVGFGLSGGNRAVGVLGGLAFAGFGLVVAAVAMRLDPPPTD
jgi:hypothetical protein